MRYFELITEAKEVIDARHEESDEKPFGSGKYHYIKPSDGFFFHYYDGVLVLHSEENEQYSAKVAGVSVPSEVWNQLNGLVQLNNKTVTIGKAYFGTSLKMRSIPDIKTLQKVLRDLKRFGVTKEFLIKGAPKNIPKTVGDVLLANDPTDKILAQQPITMFHGTSLERWKIIERAGLRPGNTGDTYNDLVSGYSEHNIYLATTEKSAEFYGKRQAKKDDDFHYVILQVDVPDPAKLLSDDRFVKRFSSRNEDLPPEEIRKSASDPSRLSQSGRELGEFAYRGIILPKHIKLVRIGNMR